MSNSETKAPKSGGSLPVPKLNRGVKGFYQDVMREMKHVNWPTRQETTRLTGVVLALCVALVLVLYGLSIAFEVLLKILITGGN